MEEKHVRRAVHTARQALRDASNATNGEGTGMSQLIKLIGAKQCGAAFDGCQRSLPYSSPSPQDTQPC